MKYQIGDKLKITARVAGHRFDIGEIVKVVFLFPEGNDPHYEAYNEHGKSWFIGDDEVEFVEKGEIIND